MDEQYMDGRVIPSERTEGLDQAVIIQPVVNTDHFVDNVPVTTAQIHEVPMGGTVAAAYPLTPQADPVTNYDYPIHALPVEETGEAVDLLEGNRDRQMPAMVSAAVTVPPQAALNPNVGALAALLPQDQSDQFRKRWNEIQGKFVDDPRTAVQQADVLVSDVVGQITKMFADNHITLESQWNQGNDVSTEDLRKALQHYRSFFNRLVV